MQTIIKQWIGHPILKQVLSLLVLGALTAVICGYGRPATLAGPVMSTMFIGFIVLAAWLAGVLGERVRLPKISGYLLLGLVVGPSVIGLLPKSQIDEHMVFINDLAVCLIALVAGAEIELRFLRGKAWRTIVLIGTHVLGVVVLSILVIGFASPWIPFMRGISRSEVWIVASLLGVVMIASSPAVIVAMICDFKAHGPLAQTTLVVAVLKDLILVVLFAIVLAVGKAVIGGGSAFSLGFACAIAIELLGSVILGGVFGVVMAWYATHVRSHLSIFVVGWCLLIALVGEQHFTIAGHRAHLESLLMALSAGLLMRNVWGKGNGAFFHTLEHMSLPVYCLFFALAGAGIDIGLFVGLWFVALGLVALRSAGTWLSLHLGFHLTGERGDWTNLVWLGLLSQAGVSLVLAGLIRTNFADQRWSLGAFNALISAVFINQLIGPVGFRYGLMHSGEADAPAPIGG